MFQVPVGWALFAGVPLLLWLIGAAASKRTGVNPFLGFIGGSDHRLSLSRVQAFAWTLVIFGAFVSAMAVSTQVTADQWIKIPDAVLQLAAIAIGTGVFSSLISTVSGEEKEAVVTTLSYRSATGGADAAWAVTGSGFAGTEGRVRLNGTNLHVQGWTDTSITFDAPAALAASSVLVIDTSAGKAANFVSGQPQNPRLGDDTVCYEAIDLFRNDKDPHQSDLMKFQMFGWTVIAVSIYVVVFLSNLSANIKALPVVDPSIVILTGVSQTGYLAGKGVTAQKK